MGFRLLSAGRSDVGLVRERNEDAFAIEPNLGVYVVCDGMGGHLGGQVASQTAVARIVEVLRSGIEPEGKDPDRLVKAIQYANRSVFEQARRDPALHNMGTTVVAIRSDAERLHLCHVGDSRIYRLRGSKLEQLTRDHSLANLYEELPMLAGRFGPAQDNVIVRAVGLHDSVDVDHRAVEIQNDDVFLLCSDGLTDMVEDWLLQEVLRDGLAGSVEECSDTLIRTAIANGGADNATAVVLRVQVQG